MTPEYAMQSVTVRVEAVITGPKVCILLLWPLRSRVTNAVERVSNNLLASTQSR